MLEIITNNQPRNLLYGSELTDKQKEDFDYIDDIDSHDFISYKGQIYDPSEFMRTEEKGDFAAWQGYSSDSAFSGVLLRYTEDQEQVIMGTYYS